jgi:hypothetical protein
MYDYKELYIKIIILLVLQTMIQYYPSLTRYNNETKFNYYRSAMCYAFTFIGLDIGINHFTDGFAHPFSYYHYEMDEIQYLFMAYLIVDILKMLAMKNNRIDLYAHHIICIISIILAKSIDKFGYLHALLLICESISIVTGIDSQAMEDDDTYLSYQCKRFRKNVIRYIRYPMWILLFIFTIKYTDKSHPIIWYNGLFISIVMFCLDTYWESKCDKVIDKYES